MSEMKRNGSLNRHLFIGTAVVTGATFTHGQLAVRHPTR